MSTFLIHQEPAYVVVLADTLGTRSSARSPGVLPLTAPKIVEVAPCAYAAHAGTWQPALEMLTRLREHLLAPPAAIPWEQLTELMRSIGSDTYSHFQQVFALESFDVRVALVLTGYLRHAEDVAAGRSSTLVLWESARSFRPERVVGFLHFGGSKPLSDLATLVLSQPFVANLLHQSPLSCAQALLAAHALLAKLSTSIGPEPSVLVCGADAEHTMIHGTLVTLPQGALIRG